MICPVLFLASFLSSQPQSVSVGSIPKLKFDPSLRPRPPLKLPFILVRDGEWRLPYEGMELLGGGAAQCRCREKG